MGRIILLIEIDEKSLSKIKSLTNRGRNLGILDFFGFESVEKNSFEQLNINYCSERIHQSYIQIVLKYQQDLYVREGLEWTKIDFYDNQSICEMMDKVGSLGRKVCVGQTNKRLFSAPLRFLLSNGRAKGDVRRDFTAASRPMLVRTRELLNARPRSTEVLSVSFSAAQTTADVN